MKQTPFTYQSNGKKHTLNISVEPVTPRDMESLRTLYYAYRSSFTQLTQPEMAALGDA